MPIVRASLARRAPKGDWSIQPQLLMRLVTDPWIGNVRSLHAEVERLCLASKDGVLAEPISPLDIPDTPAVYRVASDASWFEDRDGKYVDMRSRPVLRAVLAALIDGYNHKRGVTMNRIVERAWPNMHLIPQAKANRVHVAFSTLRKLGFGASIVHQGDSYHFVATMEIVDP